MPRPPLPLGTYGAVRIYGQSGAYRARTLYRDFDGHTRAVERSGRSRAAAEGALRLALRDRARVSTGTEITPETLVRVLAIAWMDGLVDRSPTTLEAYRQRLEAQILPALGATRVRELTVGTVDRFLGTVAKKNGPAVAKMCKSVLSGMAALAARHDALDRNPVRDARSLPARPSRAPRALSREEVRLLRQRVHADAQAVLRDLPDFVSFMLATGLRIGEAAAVTWDAVDLVAGVVEVRGTVIRVRGEGLQVKPSPKTRAGFRTLALPTWAGDLLRRRAQAGPRPDDPVFPAPLGGLRDPSNTQADLRQAMTTAGFAWVTSHVFRKTVATLMDEAGLSARAAADQLGHAAPSMTQDVYYGRKVAATGAAAVLETLE